MIQILELPGVASMAATATTPGGLVAASAVPDAERLRALGHTDDDLAFFQTQQPLCGSPPKEEKESEKLGERI